MCCATIDNKDIRPLDKDMVRYKVSWYSGLGIDCMVYYIDIDDFDRGDYNVVIDKLFERLVQENSAYLMDINSKDFIDFYKEYEDIYILNSDYQRALIHSGTFNIEECACACNN